MQQITETFDIKNDETSEYFNYNTNYFKFVNRNMNKIYNFFHTE